MDEVKSGLNLMRRMPPASCENSLAGLLTLSPHLAEELLQRIDLPLKTMEDTDAGQTFVLCDYNRDGDSFRSPWSNQYFPPIEDGLMPSEDLRKMEQLANFVFDTYRKLYFEGGYSSVYFWDLEKGSFAACFLIQKSVENS